MSRRNPETFVHLFEMEFGKEARAMREGGIQITEVEAAARFGHCVVTHPSRFQKALDALSARAVKLWSKLKTEWADFRMYDPDQAYLNGAEDIYDLEYRMRELDKRGRNNWASSRTARYY